MWEYEPLNWTKEPPTKAGLYWIYNGEEVWGLALEYSKSYGLFSGDCYLKELISDLKITHWLGPLPVPEQPKE